MDQSQRTIAATPSSSRSYQFHPARTAIIDLFNLYLGRGNRQKPDESVRDPPNKSQKRVQAPNRDLPPRNEQFISDFEQLQTQFNDPEQLRTITESVLISLLGGFIYYQIDKVHILLFKTAVEPLDHE